MRDSRVRQLVVQALIAAVYSAVSLALPALSYGPVQIRFAEALTLLPVISTGAVWGVTLGCFLTNLIGVFLGANILGALDVAVGTAATLLAALLTRFLRDVRFGRVPVAAALPPVLINAGAIGLELAYVSTGGFSLSAFTAAASAVGLGEAVSCFALGLPLVCFIERRGWQDRLG